MKKVPVILIVLSLLTITTRSQGTDPLDVPIDLNSKLITYQEVVPESGTKDELFNRAVYWLNEFYKSPVEVTRVRDQASGIIKGQHQFRVYYTDELGNKLDGGMVLYNFKIELKDSRYRYTIDNFVLRQVSRFPAERWLDRTDPEYNPRWDSFLKQIDAFVKQEIVPTLKAKMKPEVKVKEEEW